MLLKLKNVSKFYYSKGLIATGFSRINISFDIGEFVVITGESGSGKSTLLNVISGLDSYEEGEMYINGEETSHYREVDFENYRKKYVSNIFQNFNLVNSYTVYQNIELVLLLNGYKKKEVKTKVLDLIKKVNLTRYKNTKVSKLSGGQKQRVAIARALAKETPIIICDEPTGNLDSKAAKDIVKILKEVSLDKLVILVTHDFPLVGELATRVVEMNDGKILSDKKVVESAPVSDIKINENKGIGLANIIRLGIRNTFNIIPKFLLIFFVFLFVAMSLLSEYASLQKDKYENSLSGSNYKFNDISDTRIVVTKKDKSIISEDEISTISNIPNVESVIPNDYIIDEWVSFSSKENYYYISGILASIEKFPGGLDIGRMPEKDNEVVVYANSYDYDLIYNTNEVLKTSFIYDLDRSFPSIKIVGIKYRDESEYSSDSIIYGSNAFLSTYEKQFMRNITEGTITINNHEFTLNSDNITFNIKPNSNIKKGEAYVYEECNFYCKNYNCKNSKLNLKVNNIYYEETLSLKITNVYNEKNSKKLLNINNKDTNYQSIFINPEDYDYLLNKGIYQLSVYATDKDTVTEVNNTLTELGYKPLEVRKTLVNDFEEVLKFFEIFSLVITIVLIITLFFIAYFVIKLILKSRNVYFSTLRILGANNKHLKKILDVELINNATIAYITYLIIILLTKIGVIKNNIINDILSYLHFKDYLIMYLVLVLMSYLISTRFSKKIFKNSAMKTYKEEV